MGIKFEDLPKTMQERVLETLKKEKESLKRGFDTQIEESKKLNRSSTMKCLLMEGIENFDSTTEKRYYAALKERIANKEIVAFRYHREKFVIGKQGSGFIYYTPDFQVLHNDGTKEQVEIKGGFIRDAALVRFRTAKMLYPEYKWTMIKYENKKFTIKE